MTAPTALSGLSEIADRYDAVLCDVWGVVHNGREAFPAACAALARFSAERGPVVLITNAPRPAASVAVILDRLGAPRESWDAIATSGDTTRALLAERAPGPAWALGPERDLPLYEGLGLDFAPMEEAAFISCTGPFDDETEGPEDYRARFEWAVGKGLPMICANPDIVVQRGDSIIYCGGALARLYSQMGGEVLMAGKPYAATYDLAVAEAERVAGRPVERARILCVGDGVVTDIKGANDQGLDALFIASGIHGADAVTAGGLDARAVERLLAEEGVHARWAMADLVW